MIFIMIFEYRDFDIYLFLMLWLIYSYEVILDGCYKHKVNKVAEN